MANTIVVCGYGSGISHAVAERFGQEGFRIGLVARTREKLDAAQASLKQRGFDVETFCADLSDPVATRDALAAVHAAMGPISVIHWNAAASTAGDLLTADADAVRQALDVTVTSVVSAVQQAHADLKAQRGAVLITNGGLGLAVPQMTAMAVKASRMGTAVGNAAKHKLVGLLAERLRPDGIFVGEVMVMGVVKGTASDLGHATITASAVAERFWELYTRRDPSSVEIR